MPWCPACRHIHCDISKSYVSSRGNTDLCSQCETKMAQIGMGDIKCYECGAPIYCKVRRWWPDIVKGEFCFYVTCDNGHSLPIIFNDEIFFR